MENKSINNTKKVAKNTLYLYLRAFLVMTISIYTSRVVLDVLGVDNYGIYNVVGGFVSLFSVFSGTLTAATQRFIAFELGKDKPQIAKVFSTAIHGFASLRIVGDNRNMVPLQQDEYCTGTKRCRHVGVPVFHIDFLYFVNKHSL